MGKANRNKSRLPSSFLLQKNTGNLKHQLNHLSEDKTDSCIEAATAEIEKLEPKMADLKSVQKSLKNELDKITAERDRLKALMDELEEQVQQELQPKVDELRTTMADYAVALANHSSLSTLGRAQTTIRENPTEYKSKAEPPKFTIKEYFDREFIRSMNSADGSASFRSIRLMVRRL